MTGPFSEALRDITGPQRREGVNPLTEDSVGPFSAALQSIEFVPTKLELERTGPREALEGFKIGLFRPLEILTGPPEEIGTDHPIAKTVGEFGGILVSFVPFFKGTQIALKGVGLTSRVSPLIASIMEGSISFGLFEAGSGDLEGAPKRFAEGAVIGAGFEAVFAGAAVAYRSKFFRRVDPDAVSLERAIRPEESVNPDEVVKKLRDIGRTDKQLEVLAGEIAAGFRPNGIAIIPGVRNPSRVVSALKKELPDFNFHVRPSEERGFFEILSIDPSVEVPQLLRRVIEERPPKIELGGEGPRSLTLKQAIELIEKETPERIGIPITTEAGIPVNVESIMNKAVFRRPTVMGKAVYDPPAIFLAENLTDATKFEVLVHEYMHFISQSFAPTGVPTFTSVFGKEAVGKVLGREIRSFVAVDEALLGEFKRLTEEVLVSFTGKTRGEVRDFLAGNEEYYLKHTELISRAAEMIAIDPARVKKIAPTVFRLMSDLIKRESPKLRMLLSRGDMLNLDDLLRNNLQVFDRRFIETTKFKLSPAQASQFSRTGVFRGMEAFYNGRPVETLRRTPKGVFVRTADTGIVKLVPFEELQRPIYPQVIERTKNLQSVVMNAVDNPPQWVGVLLSDELAGGVRKAILNLENFQLVKGGERGIENVARNIRTRAFTNKREVVNYFVGQGKDGVLLEDNGVLTALIGKEEALTIADRAIYSGLLRAPDAAVGATEIPITSRSLIETALRNAGATEREIPRLVRIAEQESGERALQEVVDAEVRESLVRAMQEAARAVDDTPTLAQRSELRTTQTTSGETRVHPRDSNVELLRSFDDDEIRNFSTSAGSFDLMADEIVSGTQVPTGAAFSSGGGPPPRMQAQSLAQPSPSERGGFIQKILDAANLFAPVFTAMENVAKSAERVGLGPAFSKVFLPLQEAAQRVSSELGAVTRESLKGRTFNDQIRLIRDLAARVPFKRHETVIRYIESLSRSEVQRPGGLISRGMTADELKVAESINKLGLKDDVPRLLSTERLARRFLGNRKKFLTKLDKLEATQISQELRDTITNLRQLAAAPNVPKSVEDVFKALGLSNEERVAIVLLNKGRKLGKDRFSEFTVSRWLAAPELKTGFKDARAQFAAENKMTAVELNLAKELDRHFKAAFEISGLDARRELAGYWPHMRVYVENGMMMDNSFMRQILPPRSIEWSASKFRSGELDIYGTDPVLTAYKHVRALFMKQHFDPVLEKVARPGLREIKAKDSRMYNIMNEYAHELMGTPHASFDRLNKAIATVARVFGHQAPERLAESFINNTVGLAYSAAIPFRAALILRNYFQMFQMVAPRLGPVDFFKGLEKTLTEEGYRETVKAGVIPVGVTPVSASTEVLGANLFKRTGQVQLRMRKLFEKGFNWYKKADDVGRATAFHGMRSRVSRFLPDYMQGRISYEEFKARAKILTFDSNDIAEFDRLFKAGQIQEATDFLGKQLAREAHFRYGHSNHPAGWGSVYGRVFGQFGTWPVQYKDLLLSQLARGTTKDKFEFLFTHAAVNLGIVGAGAAVGLNLWSWVSFPSLQYTGGPFADLTIDLVRAIGGTDAEQAMARRSLLFQFPTLDDPRSIFVPGSYFIGDIWSALQDQDPGLKTVMEAGGFRFLEPSDDVPVVDWLLGR